MNRTMLMSVFAVAGFAAAANADVTYLTQARSVTVVGNGPAVSVSSPDFSPFNETASNPTIVSMISGNMATQNSSLLSDRLTVSTSLTGSDGVQGLGYGSASSFDVTFTLDQATDFHFFGNWILGDRVFTPGTYPLTFPRDSYIRLSGPGTDLSSSIPSFPPFTVDGLLGDFDFAGTLQPGQYRLEVVVDWTVNVGISAGGVRGDFDVTLIVPASSSALAFLPAMGFVARRRRR